MRVLRALKLISMAAIVSTLVTICLWTSCASQPEGGSRLQERQLPRFARPPFIKPPVESRADAPHIAKPTENDHKTGELAGAGAGAGARALAVRRMSQDVTSGSCLPIECVINDEETIPCRKVGDEVYLPFNFIKEYFEVYGTLDQGENGQERLDFHHANSVVHPPRATYQPSSIFMAFDHYNVENRDRVKCVTASEGVPVTTQWSKGGYHYPIQVAQFALSHHGKHIVQGAPDQLVLEDAESEDVVKHWLMPDKKSAVRVQQFGTSDSHVMEFSTSDSLTVKGISLTAQEKLKKCFSLDMRFVSNGSLTVVVATSGGGIFKIHYVFTSTFVAFDGKMNIVYGLGILHSNWIHLARDLKVDLLKGLLVKYKMDQIKTGFSVTKTVEFHLHGRGWLDNLTMSQSIHMDQFYSAAKWLVNHQDSRGGWPVMVSRMLIGFPALAPGWYSAMGQGQAMSVLVRAYLDSRNPVYLDTAVKALKLFQIDSVHGGVRAHFFDKYYWYEEYPTTPSSFVLNGFIYSLLGLYDLKETASGDDQVLASQIYDSGMTSLKNMLPMYDSGAGTFYDLRHITTGTQPNRARWDYHTTHINQILQLMIIDDDEIFKSTAQRWLSYLTGKKSRHN